MINVIGLGYIGLPTALMFAARGIEVIGTDINSKLIDTLASGEPTFHELGLKQLFNNAINNGIKFSTDYQKADIYIIAVPTPFAKKSKKLDPKYVIEAVKGVLDVCNKGALIIIESTVSPGSIKEYIRPEIKKKGLVDGKDIHLIHAPERIIPGNMIYELENNSRTIGSDNREIGEKAKELYSSFCKAEIVLTDIKSAEMSKVVENTYRDVNIAFANELAKICKAGELDVYEIINIANKHPRVNILQPGPGVGGHCISVDPWFLVGDYPDLAKLIFASRQINDSMPSYILARIRDIMKEHNITDYTKVGLYGLAYKENVEDIRESPTLQLLDVLNEQLIFGIKVYDPIVKERIVQNQIMDFDEFLKKIKILVIMTAHNHIKDCKESVRKKIVFDTRNILQFEGVYRL